MNTTQLSNNEVIWYAAVETDFFVAVEFRSGNQIRDIDV